MDTSPIKTLITEATDCQAMGRLSEIVVALSSWYATLGEQMENILIFKADRWLDLRKDEKSDKMADRKWDASNEGKEEIRLRSQLKYLEKFISSLKLRLKVKEGESYGKY